MTERYEMPWRPNYDAVSALTWMGAAAAAILVGNLLPLPMAPFVAMAAASGGFGALRTVQAARHAARKRRLGGRRLRFITLDQLRAHMASARKRVYQPPPAVPGMEGLEASLPDALSLTDEVWLGGGFEWDQPHTQLAYEILKRDKSKILPPAMQMGATWIHGVNAGERDLYLPIDATKGHGLIVGTTGSGKTRLLDLLVAQAILRRECCIIIDPKGDHELRENARRACVASGRPDLFFWFHPAFPSQSCRVDAMQNFSRPTELAARIAAIMPSQNANDPFRNFSQMAVNNIVQGLLLAGRKPSIALIRHCMDGGLADLVGKAVTGWCRSRDPNWPALADAKARASKSKDPEAQARALAAAYRELVRPHHPNQDLDGLLAMFDHDKGHFGKMTASLLPVLGQLSSGPMGALLSPDRSDDADPRPVVDTKKIVERGGVLYIGLDSLSDAIVGSAIGSLILADLAAVAGDRYNHGSGGIPVNLFVDEAAEVVNDPLIQLLNKGRGASFRLWLATQTFADFVARTGSEYKARQILGNINNTISLRVTDNETQQYLTEGLPMVNVRYVMVTQGSTIGTGGLSPFQFSGNAGERLMEEERALFEPALLGQLPNLEFIAKVAGGKIWKGRLPILEG